MKIKKVIVETPDVKTFRLEFLDERLKREFSFKPGQFGEFSVFGVGEAPFCIASAPTHLDYIECSVKRVGSLTEALHNLEEDKIIGFRGPYGNGFPIEELKGKNLIFIGGGIGIAALKSLILHCLDRKEDFQNLTLIYGARNVADLVYKREMEEWEEKGALKVFITVDPGGDIPGWRGKVGFVPQIVKELAPSWENSVSIICGPPIMIKFTIEVLESLNFSPTQIMTTLEMKMKCGIGKCGRCNLGNLYVCRDGPVFTYAQLQKLPQEY